MLPVSVSQTVMVSLAQENFKVSVVDLSYRHFKRLNLIKANVVKKIKLKENVFKGS